MSKSEKDVEEYSLKSYFIPITNYKVIYILAIIGFIVYGNILFNGFALDDKSLTVDNPQLQTLSLKGLFGSGINDGAGLYRPVQTLYLLFIPTVPFFYHFWQLVLHIVNAILLYILFHKFFNKKLSLVLAVIFLVHPIQVESVSYIAASTNQLFSLFGITALLLGLDTHIPVKRVIYISLLLLLSMFSREIGFLFFVLLIAYRFIFRQGQVWQIAIAGTLSILTYLYIRFALGGVYPEHITLIPITNLPLSERIIHIPAIIFYYLKIFFFPLHLAVMQYWTLSGINFLNFYLPLVLVSLFFITLISIGLYLRSKSKKTFFIFCFFFVWLVIGLGPHLQIYPLDATVADRWFYFPIVGMLGMLGAVIYWFIESKYELRKVIYILLIFIVVILSVRTMIRNTNWADILTLYLHDSKINNNFIIENNIGSEYAQKGNYREALKHDLKSVDMYAYEGNLHNVGLDYERLGNIQKAREYYNKALNSGVRYTRDHNHELFVYERVGMFLLLHDTPQAANTFLENAVKDYPNAGNLWSLLAVSENKLGNQEKALEYAAKGKNLTPTKGTIYTYRQILNNQPVILRPF